MNENESIPSNSPPRPQPWNKGKLIGAKPPLRASHVWSIRTKLQLEKRTRDLALIQSRHRQQTARLRCRGNTRR